MKLLLVNNLHSSYYNPLIPVYLLNLKAVSNSEFDVRSEHQKKESAA